MNTKNQPVVKFKTIERAKQAKAEAAPAQVAQPVQWNDLSDRKKAPLYLKVARLRIEHLEKTNSELIETLKSLIYRNEIMLDYIDNGRLEQRWTARDGIAEPNSIAYSGTLIEAVKQAKDIVAKAEGKL